MSQSDHNPQPHKQVDLDAEYGLLAEFPDVDSVTAAAVAVREAGYRYFDVHSPFPLHGIDKAIGTKPTILPWITLVCGLTGCAAGLFLTIYTMSATVDLPLESLEGYPYIVSGKPLVSLPAFIPVIFELTILFSAFGAAFGMLLLNKLPMLYHPLLKVDRFRRATQDRFFVVVEARDEKYDQDQTGNLLRQQGATAVEVVPE